MKCKKHPTALWEFFTAKSEQRSLWVMRDISPSIPPTAGCIFQAQPAHHNDAVRPAIADRIAIEQQTNRKGATFL